MEMFYSCEQVADRYGVKVSTVWTWIRDKKIPAVRIGRIYKIKEKDLEQFEHENKTIGE